MTLSRRELFAMFRRPAPAIAAAGDPAAGIAPASPAAAADRAADRSLPPAFSLEAFYARRGAEQPGAPGLAPFAVRCDRPAVPSTRIGAGVTGETRSPGAALARGGPQHAGAARLDPGWVPQVLPDRCLARSFCTTCVEHCPRPGAIAWGSGGPRVDPARCDGCGVCVAVCPAPTLAFQLVRRGAP